MPTTHDNSCCACASRVKKDLRIWQTFLDSFSGKFFFLAEGWSSSYSLCFYTAAAQSKGYGLIFGKQWAYGRWPESWTEYNISFLEFFPIVSGLGIWSYELKNRRELFFTDNESTVYVINKQTTKDPELLRLLRALVPTCLKNNILFRARHIRGTKNIPADHLSRLHIERFKALTPGMNPVPAPLPTHFLPSTHSGPNFPDLD